MPSSTDRSSEDPSPAVIEFKSVVITLGSFPALSGLDLRVDAGELVLLRGPNGAGKTTLLRVCAGLLPVQGGHAMVFGTDVRRDRRGVRTRVGMLGHTGFLYEDLTVEENVRFAVRAAKGDVAAVPAVLARVGLDGRIANLAVAHCSAGQRRRTSLAAVVARQPRLWLLDEPHASLDSDSRDLLDSVVREAVEGGATVLLASHDDDRAGALATRVVTVDGGHVTADSPTPRGRVAVIPTSEATADVA